MQLTNLQASSNTWQVDIPSKSIKSIFPISNWNSFFQISFLSDYKYSNVYTVIGY